MEVKKKVWQPKGSNQRTFQKRSRTHSQLLFSNKNNVYREIFNLALTNIISAPPSISCFILFEYFWINFAKFINIICFSLKFLENKSDFVSLDGVRINFVSTAVGL